MAKSFLDAEREFYIANGATSSGRSSLAELRRSFYEKQLSTDSSNRPVTQIELEWLRKYSGLDLNDRNALWRGVATAQGLTVPDNIPLNEVRYLVYLTQTLP